MNLPGILGIVSAVIAQFTFAAAGHTGKGGELIPLAVTLLAGIAAIVLAGVGWVRGRRRGGERVSSLLAAAFGLSSIALLVFWPAMPREHSNTQPCASALRQIGQALYMYSKDHGGRIPDRLQDLTVGPDADLTPDALLCRYGSDPLGQCSFDYLGAGRAYDDFSADDIVAFEPPHNHQSDGGYVLFGDGDIEFVYPASELREGVGRLKKKLTTRPAATLPATTTGAGENR